VIAEQTLEYPICTPGNGRGCANGTELDDKGETGSGCTAELNVVLRLWRLVSGTDSGGG
jgi:hypothetical protein